MHFFYLVVNSLIKVLGFFFRKKNNKGQQIVPENGLFLN
jgi:hypothetical protein